jgi:hypothetical protein
VLRPRRAAGEEWPSFDDANRCRRRTTRKGAAAVQNCSSGGRRAKCHSLWSAAEAEAEAVATARVAHSVLKACVSGWRSCELVAGSTSPGSRLVLDFGEQASG